MAVRGIFNSHSGLAGEIKNDFSSKLLRFGFMGTAPLTALSVGMPSEQAVSYTFSWADISHISGNQAATAAALVGATTIVVDDAGIWKERSIIMNQDSGEYMLITAVASDNQTLTVIRGLGGTTAVAVAVADSFQLIGSAFAQGSGKPESISQNGELFHNNLQIVKTGWSITGTARRISFTTGSKLATNKQECAGFHAEDLERTALWGVSSSSTSGGSIVTTTNGIVTQIERQGGNVFSANTGGVAGELSLTDFETYMGTIHQKNAQGMPNERVVFGGFNALAVLNRCVQLDSTYDIKVNETAYGINVTEFTGLNYRLKFMTHPLMTENSAWSNEMYILHPGLLKRRYLSETLYPEFLIDSNTNAGVDADEGFIQDEIGWEVRGAQTMGIIRNIKTAVKS